MASPGAGQLSIRLALPADAQGMSPAPSLTAERGVCWHGECIGLCRQRSLIHPLEHEAIEVPLSRALQAA